MEEVSVHSSSTTAPRNPTARLMPEKIASVMELEFYSDCGGSGRDNTAGSLTGGTTTRKPYPMAAGAYPRAEAGKDSRDGHARLRTWFLRPQRLLRRTHESSPSTRARGRFYFLVSPTGS
jgi:hypothetical protein